MRYVSGTVTSRMAEAFHGERKIDAHDAYVIAQTLRMRGDLPTLTVADGVQQQLKLLVSRRLDLVADRVRITARIQDLLTMISPALEKTLNLRSRGALRLLAQWQTPAGLRRAGETRILAYLRQHGVRAAKALTAKVLTAARTQTVAVAGEATAAVTVAQMATDLEAVNDRITAIEETIAAVGAEHELGEIVTSLPGIGTTLAAEFLAHAGTLTTYPSPRGTRRSRRARTDLPGLRPPPRPPGPTPPLPPRPAPGVQHVQLHRPDPLPTITRLLRQETSRRKDPPPSHRSPVQTTPQRPLGLHPRQDPLPAQTTKISRGGAVRTRVETPWAGRTAVRGTWVNVGHSLPPQVNPRSLD